MNTAEIWYVFVDDSTGTSAIVSRAEPRLSSEERERARRFVFRSDRREFVLAHALVRTMLSHFANVPPEDWKFGPNAHDRPEVLAPASCSHFRFNLSHTRGLVACIVAAGREVGLDVESVAPEHRSMDIARRFFSPDEVAGLDGLPAADRAMAFLDLWTLKEAYVKARGLGLSIPLDTFWFQPGPGRVPRLHTHPALGDDAESWQFERYRPREDYRMAVAVRRGRGPDVPLSFREIAVNAVIGTRRETGGDAK